MKKYFLLSVYLILSGFKALCQGDIPVNLYTGLAGIGVSLGTVNGHGLSDNISLSYDTRGIALTARNGYYGLGWSLNAGGSITREVRGLPDDFQSTGSDTRRGWFYDQNNLNTGTFTNSSDVSTATCSDELSDYNFISALGYKKDTQPDIFYYAIPGYSGSFVFDNATSPIIRLIPYADIKVEVKYVLHTQIIAGFKITTNNGNQYVFNTYSTETKSAVPGEIAGVPQPVEFQKTDFELFYKAGGLPTPVTFKYQWVLDSVKAPNSAYLYYTYSDIIEYDYLYQPKYSLAFSSYSYSIDAKRTEKKLTGIYSSSGEEVLFKYKILSMDTAAKDVSGVLLVSEIDKDQNDLLHEVVHNDKRRAAGNFFVKKYSIVYDYYYPCPEGCDEAIDGSGMVKAAFNRAFVKSIREESSCNKIAPYEFSYTTPEKFPLPIYNAFDAWGYYNQGSGTSKIYIYPQLPAQERYRMFPISNYTGEKYEMTVYSFLPVEDSTKIGMLSSIKFPSGGSAKLDFELNEFYDPVANETYKAGGLRVKIITYSDGLNEAKNIIENYSYQLSTGLSSGKLLNQPKFIIPTDEYQKSTNPIAYSSYQELIQQGNNPWTYLAHKSFVDINNARGENSVVYASGKISRTGQGYSIAEFSTPATWGESTTGEWSAATVKIARSSACNSVDFITSGTFNIYPYPENPIYTYAQGLPLTVRHFTEQGVLVSETVNEYQDIYKTGINAYKVYGLRYEKIPYWTDGYLFSKYNYLTDAGKVLSTQTTKEYDATNPAKFTTVVRSYFFESTAHKLLTRTQQTNTDGAVYTTHYKYPLDYGSISANASEPALMIKKLQDNFRNGTPLESYTTITPFGGSAKTIAAGVTILSSFGGVQPLVKHTLSLNRKELTNFIPSSIQSDQVVVDSNYDTLNTILSYSSYFIPSSWKGNDRIFQGSIMGYNYTTPVASIGNALPEQVAFSDFETTTQRSFDVTGVQVNGQPRSGYTSIHPTVVLSKSLNKGSGTYVLSGWLLKKQASVLNLYVKNITKTTTYHSQAINFGGGGSVFEYFEYTFPVDASLTDFVVEIHCTVPSPPSDPALMPLLDDVAIYPANAELSTSTYVHPFGATSGTNRDQTGYIVYDDVGRVRYKKDKDGNIRERNTYYNPNTTIQPGASEAFEFPPFPYVLEPITVESLVPDCFSGLSYEWDFGSGFIPGSKTTTYTFQSYGDKTIKLRTTSAEQGVNKYEQTVFVQLPTDKRANFTYSSPAYLNEPIVFTATDNSSLGSVTYEWDFGQGYAVGPRVITQTITSAIPITLQVSLRVTSNNPVALSQVYTKQLLLKPNPDPQ